MPNAPSSSPNGEILYPKEIMTPPGGQESFGGVPISPEVPEGYEVDPDAEETAIDIMEAVETGGSEDARAIDELLRDPQERAELVQAIETDPEVQNVLTRGFAGAKELVRKTLNTLKYAPYHLHASLILGLYSLGAASTGNAGPISWEAAGNVSGTPIPTPVSIPSATGPTGGAGDHVSGGAGGGGMMDRGAFDLVAFLGLSAFGASVHKNLRTKLQTKYGVTNVPNLRKGVRQEVGNFLSVRKTPTDPNYKHVKAQEGRLIGGAAAAVAGSILDGNALGLSDLLNQLVSTPTGIPIVPEIALASFLMRVIAGFQSGKGITASTIPGISSAVKNLAAYVAASGGTGMLIGSDRWETVLMGLIAQLAVAYHSRKAEHKELNPERSIKQEVDEAVKEFVRQALAGGMTNLTSGQVKAISQKATALKNLGALVEEKAKEKGEGVIGFLGGVTAKGVLDEALTQLGLGSFSQNLVEGLATKLKIPGFGGSKKSS